MKILTLKLRKPALALVIFLGFMIILSATAFSDTSQLDPGLDDSEVLEDQSTSKETPSEDLVLDDLETPIAESLSSGDPEEQEEEEPLIGQPEAPEPQTVSNIGAATQKYSIVVPPGRNGLQPDISLQYSSYNGNGWLGVGWDLSMGSIGRSTKHGLDYDADDYVVDGSELVRRDDWKTAPDDNFYGAKIEGAFTKYQYISESEGWVATATDGSKYYYGSRFLSDPNSKSQMTNTYGTFSWHLDKVEDTNGNYMEINYTIDQNQVYLSSIYYTYHQNFSGYTYSVEFSLEDRTDPINSYKTHALVTTAKRLNTITVKKVDGTSVYKYGLNYNNSGPNGRSRLEQIKRVDPDNENNSLPPYVFSYIDGGNGTFDDESPPLSLANETDSWSAIMFGDINGDGRQDFIQAYAPNHDGGDLYAYPYLANSSGGFTAQTSIDLEPCLYTYRSVSLGDVNGDGCADILSNSFSKAHVYLSQKDGSDNWVGFPNKRTTDYPNGTGGLASLADVNGDGKADLVILNGSGAYTFISEGNGYFGDENTFLVPLPPDAIVQDSNTNLSDVNGDGKADLYLYHHFTVPVFPDEIPGTLIQIYLGNGNGTFSSTAYFTFAYTGEEAFRINSGSLADINGDGLSDLTFLDPDNKLYVYLSTGTGMIRVQAEPDRIMYVAANRFADMDDDGMADMFNFDSSGNILFYKSNGNGTFADPIQAGGIAEGLSSYLVFADIDGDGKSDIIKKERLTNALSYSLAAGEDAADCIEIVSNPLGGKTEIAYRNSSGLPDNRNPGIVHPVEVVEVYDGIPDDTNNSIDIPDVTSYNYSGAYYDHVEKEFRGFKNIYKTNPDSTYEVTQYLQEDYYTKNRPEWTGIYENEASYDSGKLLNELLTSSLNYTQYSWDTDPATPDTWAFVKLNQKKITYEGNSDYFTQEDYTYDGNGFPEYVYKNGTDANDQQVEQITKYTHYGEYGTDTWRPDIETVTGATTGPARKMTYNYDGNGNMTEKIFWRTPSVAYPPIIYEHDNYGNVTIETDGLGNKTWIEYDIATETFPWKITAAYDEGSTDIHHNQVTTKTWNYNFGKEYTVTDPNNNYAENKYDPFGRTDTVTNYNSQGNVAGQTDIDYHDIFPVYVHTKILESGDIGSGSYVEKDDYFDGLGRPFKTVTDGIDELGASTEVITTTKYDDMGRKWLVEGPDFFANQGTGYYEETLYDKLGRVTFIKSPDGEPTPITISYSYSNPFTTEITDPDGKKKTEKQDHLGRIIEVIEYAGLDVASPVLQTTGYEYNAAGDMTKVTNALNIDTEIDYDLRGLKTRMDDPDMGIWSYTYDDNGNLWTQTDAKGDIITFGYDGLNRTLTKTYTINSQETEATRNVAYTYDLAINGVGQLYSVTNTDITSVYDEYDAMGRVLSVSKTITGAQEQTIETTYDESGKVLTITYPDGFVVTNSYYPGTGLLDEVTGTMSSITVSYAKCTGYAPTGKIAEIYHGYNGTDTVYNYDSLSTRLTSVQTSGGGISIQDRAYTYTKAGDIEEIIDTHNGPTYTYTYDNLHRLLNESSTGEVPFDRAENLIFTYDDADKPNAVRNINYNGTDYGFTYDANGNMKSGYDFTDPVNIVERQITWNADNMPVTVTRDGIQTTFTYDGDGARAKKTINNSDPTYYISNDYEIKNGVATKYVFAGNLRVATIDDTDTYIFHKDHLGSSTAMTKYNDVSLEFEIEETSEYLPFGGMRAHTGDDVSDYKFTDQERDKSTNLYNYDARLYDPVVGRFISADSEVPDWSNPQSLNRYAYAKNNPLKYIDPDGHISLKPDGTVTTFTSDALQVNKTLANGIKEDFSSGNYGRAAIGSALYLANSISNLPASLAADMVVTSPYNSGASGMAGVLEGDTAKGVTGFTGCLTLGVLGKISVPNSGTIFSEGATETENLVIGRGADLSKSNALKPGEFKLEWPSKLPDYKAEWKINSGLLREEMGKGLPIRDASPGDTGGIFLNAERNLLKSRDWTFDSIKNYWMPPD